jgi:predicted metalloprotease with PDZ domain
MAIDNGGPAQLAGMHSGDFIVAIDGFPVLGIDDIYRLLV